MKRRREISCAGLQMQSPHLQRLSQGSTENASIALKSAVSLQRDDGVLDDIFSKPHLDRQSVAG
jgi:hypothetical protein